ncbi:hypothetical protein M9H77_03576 [Catharanthus roseus]|uniref:Uncharacterized protein n=1 Tax=Catharanthus roseus TaxID=4058 RepID=A0ACC0CC59_CATRO|nr:hypothetical protein M9H77_03576 [Catharanthus roseus]
MVILYDLRWGKKMAKSRQISAWHLVGTILLVRFLVICRIIWKEISEEKRIDFVYLDSLWFNMYTTSIGRNKKVLDWIKNKKILTKKYPLVPIVMLYLPQQTNGEDCGCYALYYAYLFMENAPIISNHTEDERRLVYT